MPLVPLNGRQRDLLVLRLDVLYPLLSDDLPHRSFIPLLLFAFVMLGKDDLTYSEFSNVNRRVISQSAQSFPTWAS